MTNEARSMQIIRPNGNNCGQERLIGSVERSLLSAAFGFVFDLGRTLPMSGCAVENLP